MCLSALPLKTFKGKVYPKRNILSLFTQTHVITNLYNFLYSVQHKIILGFSLHTMKVNQHLKVTFYAKITFLVEHSCLAAVCKNNQHIMLKIHQLFFFYKTNKSRTVSQNELFQILPLFTSSRGKSPAHL